ncbi:hypothetical protein D3C79_750540 [compost metagenome]
MWPRLCASHCRAAWRTAACVQTRDPALLGWKFSSASARARASGGMPISSGVGWHSLMNLPLLGAKSVPSTRHFWMPKRICSSVLMPAATKDLIQLRLAAFRASSSGQACFHAGKMACSSLNRALTTSVVPGSSCLAGACASAGRLRAVAMICVMLLGAFGVLIAHPGHQPMSCR